MRKQTMKVYHGVPKSVTDEHTVFYADLDGNTNADTGLKLTDVTGTLFNHMPTGYGITFPTQTKGTLSYKINETLSIYDEFTIEFWINVAEFRNLTSGYPEVITLTTRPGDEARSMKVYFSSNSKVLYIEIYNSTWYLAYDVTPKIANLPDLCHIRLTSNGNVFNTYCNGKKVSTYTVRASENHRSFESLLLHSNRLYSDVHISNIDRGDYFPNLPQDFIDGKAIIRPKFGQQQIKGDPMYSQVTNVKIDTQKSSDWVNISDGYVQNINNPEVTLNDGGFPSGSKIKIKGLNREIISGVIDTDTALAKIIKPSQNTDWVYLNDVSKISVGDELRYVYSSGLPFTSRTYSVLEVDSTNNSVKLNYVAGNWYIGDYFYEITASSSSPIVKTADGITVVGTWSGLGTNEATFTLGTNTSLAGKDLYIEYALTMPYGNSDFPELPYSVEKAWTENGVEMKPVSEVVIIDDFKGKISGSTKECPHLVKSMASSTLKPPSEFTYEHSTTGYKSIINLSDSDTLVKSTNINGEIPQQLFSFNLIEMVERKLGCEIPSRDKVQWLKGNVIYTSFEAYGYGVNQIGNNYRASIYYNSKWRKTKIHSSSTVGLIGVTNATGFSTLIQPDGFLYYLVHTDASDGTNTSSIYTDYVALKIQLKGDSTYTTLYCENKRAREDRCNPILIQKETKTVKRYLPSKECFTTECLTSISKPITNPTTTLAIRSDFAYFTSQGTGSYNSSDDYYKDCIAKIGLSSIKPYNFTNDSMDNGISFGDVRFAKDLVQTSSGNNEWTAPLTNKGNKNHLALIPHLYFKSDSSLCLGIIYRELINGAFTSNKGYAFYDIPNRPLIK